MEIELKIGVWSVIKLTRCSLNIPQNLMQVKTWIELWPETKTMYLVRETLVLIPMAGG